MPMPTQVGGMIGNDDEMERARRNRPVATRAEIGLPRRIRLDRSNGDFVHRSAEDGPDDHRQRHQCGDDDHGDVERSLRLGSKRIQSHVATVNGRGSKSEHVGDPVDRDEPRAEADGDQIHPPDTDLSRQPTELVPLRVVERFDGCPLGDSGAHFDEESDSVSGADQVDLASSDRNIASLDAHPVA